MSAAPPPTASLNPLAFLPKIPSLDNIFGSFLIATFLGMLMYGLTIYQSYKYFRLFRDDAFVLKLIIRFTESNCPTLLETFHIILCMHVCYYYLVTSYFNPLALLDGVWSIRILPLATGLVVLVSESFFTRRVYRIGNHFRWVVAIVPILMLAILGFATAATVEAYLWPTFADFERFAWTTSAGFGLAALVDSLLTGMLIIVLHKSRTGQRRTDSVIDLLIIYAVNTGLLTGIFSVCSFIFVLTSPKNLIYSAFNIIAAKMYANSLLAVLNSRKFLQHKVQGDCFTSSSLRFPEERKTSGNGTIDTWNAPRLTHLSPSQGGGTVVGISLVPTGRGQTVSSGDVESIDTAARDLEAK